MSKYFVEDLMEKIVYGIVNLLVIAIAIVDMQKMIYMKY